MLAEISTKCLLKCLLIFLHCNSSIQIFLCQLAVITSLLYKYFSISQWLPQLCCIAIWIVALISRLQCSRQQTTLLYVSTFCMLDLIGFEEELALLGDLQYYGVFCILHCNMDCCPDFWIAVWQHSRLLFCMESLPAYQILKGLKRNLYFQIDYNVSEYIGTLPHESLPRNMDS